MLSPGTWVVSLASGCAGLLLATNPGLGQSCTGYCLTTFDRSHERDRVPVVSIVRDEAIAHPDHRDISLIVGLFREQAFAESGELDHY